MILSLPPTPILRASPVHAIHDRLVEGAWSAGSVDACRGGTAVRQRELEVAGNELLDVWSSQVLELLDLSHLENVDGSETSTVTGGHVLVHVLNGLSTAHSTELLVHVVGTGARVVSEPDAEVLDLHWLLLGNLWGRGRVKRDDES